MYILLKLVLQNIKKGMRKQDYNKKKWESREILLKYYFRSFDSNYLKKKKKKNAYFTNISYSIGNLLK